MTLQVAIRGHIRRVLMKHGGKVAPTCRELKISRSTFYAYARGWAWMDSENRLCRYLVEHNGWHEKAERRRAIEGCGRANPRWFGETDIAYAERVNAPRY